MRPPILLACQPRQPHTLCHGTPAESSIAARTTRGCSAAALCSPVVVARAMRHTYSELGRLAGCAGGRPQLLVRKGARDGAATEARAHRRCFLTMRARRPRERRPPAGRAGRRRARPRALKEVAAREALRFVRAVSRGAGWRTRMHLAGARRAGRLCQTPRGPLLTRVGVVAGPGRRPPFW